MFILEDRDHKPGNLIVISQVEILGPEIWKRLNLREPNLTCQKIAASTNLIRHLSNRKPTDLTRIIFVDHPAASGTFLVARNIHMFLPSIKLIYLVGALDLVQLYLASACGFSAIATLDDSPLSVLTSIAQKRPYLSQSALRLYALHGDVHSVLGQLTLAQLLVLMHMTRRRSPDEIARHLSCSVESIYQHQARLRAAFGVCSNAKMLRIIGFGERVS